jgi:diketogulonate reductase-like aldo/keto reductase
MMQKRKFGPLENHVSLMGQGTWKMELNPKESQQALLRGIDMGLTHIDTAEMYGEGQVEEIIAPVLKTHRQNIFLVSKVLGTNASFNATIHACEQSLRRLETDRLDLYLLHWRDNIPLEETFAAFERLVEDGKIGAFGVSNFDVSDLEEGYSIAGPGKIACNQVLYHATQRAIERHIGPWCKAHQVALVAYSPLGQGSFPQNKTQTGQVLSQIADKYHASPEQIALTFLARDANTFLIPKANKIKHLEDNAQSMDIELECSDLKFLEENLPQPPENPSLPLL